MGNVAQHNFHVPMPSQMNRDLRAEAARRGIPATALVRQVLGAWIEANRRLVVTEAIAAYAVDVAGTGADLDPELEAAAVEAMGSEQER